MERHIGRYSHAAGSRSFIRAAGGFTLVEFAIVIVIAGIVLAVGGVSGYSLLEAQRLVKSKNMLEQAKECLVKRMTYSNLYPSYTGDADTPGSLDCDTAGSFDRVGRDVDNCICQIKDGWNQRLYYLEGRSSAAGNPALSAGYTFVATSETRGQTGTQPDTSSSVLDKKGNTRNSVAFVLISPGQDGVLNDTTYSTLFTGNAHAAAFPLATAPDFSHTGASANDDVILVVNGPELLGLLTE